MLNIIHNAKIKGKPYIWVLMSFAMKSLNRTFKIFQVSKNYSINAKQVTI